MIVVIVAGGMGTRLWPLSTSSYPKHLLKITADADSLLQQTYARARVVAEDVYVVSEVSHIEHVKTQLADLPDDHFIVEPARRGTANCIVLALAELSKNHDVENTVVAFIPADHYITEPAGFIECFKNAEITANNCSNIVLVGVKPDHPSIGFGYIEKGKLLSEREHSYGVVRFKEKPNYKTAVKYLVSGNFLWNSSYFLASIQTFVDEMQGHNQAMYTAYEQLRSAKPEAVTDIYLELESDSIDYALIEKDLSLVVVEAVINWMDLGSFGDLHKAVKSDDQGNYSEGEVSLSEVSNSYIRNQEEKPVAVIGLDNVAVINTPDGVLVVRKDLAQQVGVIAKQLKS